MQPVLVYSQESAVKAGGGEYINEGGAHICTITQAKYITSKKGTAGIEFSIVNESGLKANFINVYYAKAPATQGAQGERIAGGESMLNAMMGLLRLQQISAVKSGEFWVCPELTNKKIGLFLQKKLTTNANGKDGYGFEISVPFNPVDAKTMREIVENKPPQTIERMTASYKDKDERKAANSAVTTGYYPDEQDGGFGSF